MNAQAVLRSNGAKAGELVGALSDTLSEAAETVAKTIGATAAPMAEMTKIKAETLAKSVEMRAGPVAEAVGATVETLAKTVEQRAGPMAQAVGEKADALTDDLEEKLEQARKDIAEGVRNFKFGRREGLILGVTLGVFATVWLIRKIDRQAAAARLRAAGSRVGEATQGLTEKAGTYTGLAGERVGQVVQNLGARAGSVVEQVRGQGDQTVEDVKQRLSGETPFTGEVTISQTPKAEDNGNDLNQEARQKPAPEEAGSGLDEDTRAAIDAAVGQLEQVQEEAQEQARELGLSNGMKVVAFDGTDIGRVQEVREDVFVLDRPKGSDLLVPLTEVARIEGTVAYLRIDTGQVTKMGWEKA